MIGVALVVAPAEGDVDGRLHAVRPVLVQEHREELAVQAVHDVVVALEFAGHRHIPTGDHRPGFGDDALRDLAHLQDRPAQLRRDGAGRVAPAGHLRHVEREVAHPLQVRDDAQRGDDHAQVARNGRLSRHHVERPLFDLVPQQVDGLVATDDTLGEPEIGVEKRGGGTRHRGRHQVGHFDEAVRKRRQLLVERLAHWPPPRLTSHWRLPVPDERHVTHRRTTLYNRSPTRIAPPARSSMSPWAISCSRKPGQLGVPRWS